MGDTGITAIPAGLFDNNTRVTNFAGAFTSCSIAEIPAGLFDNNPLVTEFWQVFDGTLITEIPAGLFDNNPQVQDFGNAFQNCRELVTIPSGLFQYNLKVTFFFETFYGCPKAIMPEDVFTGTTSTPETRFASVTSQMYIGGFFSAEYVTSSLSSYGGTVPELWNYAYGKGYTFNYPKQYGSVLPFRARTNVTNWNSIPRDWGGPA